MGLRGVEPLTSRLSGIRPVASGDPNPTQDSSCERARRMRVSRDASESVGRPYPLRTLTQVALLTLAAAAGRGQA